MSDKSRPITTEERALLRSVFCEKPVVLRALDALDAAEKRAEAAEGDRDAMAREIGILHDLLEERARVLVHHQPIVDAARAYDLIGDRAHEGILEAVTNGLRPDLAVLVCNVLCAARRAASDAPNEMVSVEHVELERLRGIEALALRRWGEFSDVVTTVEGETIRMHVAGFIAQDLAAMFIDMADGIGAKNYVELTFSEPGASRARIVVTVQRTDGKTPNEMRVEAEKRAEEAEIMLAMLRKDAEEAVREAERLRHGVPIEGDFVCPNDLRAHDLEQDRDAWRRFGYEADDRAVALRRAVIAARQRAQQAEIERDTALPLVNAARAVVEAKTAAAEHEAERGLINLAWTSYRGPDEDEA
jgi:hypothetical protein